MELEQLMPHQPPMLLVTRVTLAEEDGGEAEAVFGRGGLFVRPDGSVDEAVHFELVAQTFAACTAVWRAGAGRGAGPEKGYLTSLRSLKIHGAADAGKTLRIRAKAAGRVEDFLIVDGGVTQDGRAIASCQVMILVPGGSSL